MVQAIRAQAEQAVVVEAEIDRERLCLDLVASVSCPGTRCR